MATGRKDSSVLFRGSKLSSLEDDFTHGVTVAQTNIMGAFVEKKFEREYINVLLNKLLGHKPPQRGGYAESFASAVSSSQHTHAILATRTVIHASVFTVIVADAPA